MTAFLVKNLYAGDTTVLPPPPPRPDSRRSFVSCMHLLASLLSISYNQILQPASSITYRVDLSPSIYPSL
ncbi:hypothetical protein ACTXT7_014421 [Hymenolepis weldensis]